MSGRIAIAFTVSACAVLIGTEVLRSVVHRHRERVQGIGGTQDIAMWGTLIAGLLLLGAMISGVIWISHKTKPNKPDALNPARASQFQIGSHWRGVSDQGR
jgi:hypothetical protein